MLSTVEVDFWRDCVSLSCKGACIVCFMVLYSSALPCFNRRPGQFASTPPTSPLSHMPSKHQYIHACHSCLQSFQNVSRHCLQSSSRYFLALESDYFSSLFFVSNSYSSTSPCHSMHITFYNITLYPADPQDLFVYWMQPKSFLLAFKPLSRRSTFLPGRLCSSSLATSLLATQSLGRSVWGCWRTTSSSLVQL